MKYLPLFLLAPTLAACTGEPVVAVETHITVNGKEATCAEVEAERIVVSFTELTNDGGGEVHTLDFACDEHPNNPSLELPQGEWTRRAEIFHKGTSPSHPIPQAWITVDDVDDVSVPINFDYGTFALAWSVSVGGQPTACSDLGSDEIAVEYASHEGLRTQAFPCGAAEATSMALPRSKTYDVYAKLKHATQNYPGVSRRQRFDEAAAPTPLTMEFRMSRSQTGQ